MKSNCIFVFHNGERKEITWEWKRAQVIFKDVQMVQTLERKERTGEGGGGGEEEGGGGQTNCNTCTQSHNIQGVARDLFPLSIVEDKITVRLHINTRVSSS